LVINCRTGDSVDWDSRTEETIEKALEVVNSAGEAYSRQLDAGDMSGAVREAERLLEACSGVDSIGVAPDSSVWALFENGLLVGLGRLPNATAQSMAARSGANGQVTASGGGEVWPRLRIVTPHDNLLYYTGVAGNMLDSMNRNLLRWFNPPLWFSGSQVTPEAARSIMVGPGVLFWSGHGTVVSLPGFGWVSGLMAGTRHDTREMAQKAAVELLDDLIPTGRHKRLAIMFCSESLRTAQGDPFVDSWYSPIILPGFVRYYANFEQQETCSYNQTKTIVHLSCCFGALGDPGDLIQAFLDQGADVVSGYDWAVHDSWSAERDWAYFCDLSDTCTAEQASWARPNVDPESIGADRAAFRSYGDGQLLLEAILQTKVGDSLYRQRQGTIGARYDSAGTVLGGILYLKTSQMRTEPTAGGQLQIRLPGCRLPGQYKTTTNDSVAVMWVDAKTGRTYLARMGAFGVSCQIDVTKWTGDGLFGSFSGRVGYWQHGSPDSMPPTHTVTLSEGAFKFSGRFAAAE